MDGYVHGQPPLVTQDQVKVTFFTCIPTHAPLELWANIRARHRTEGAETLRAWAKQRVTFILRPPAICLPLSPHLQLFHLTHPPCHMCPTSCFGHVKICFKCCNFGLAAVITYVRICSLF